MKAPLVRDQFGLPQLIPQTGWLKQKEFIFLHFWRLGSTSSGCQPVWLLARALFLTWRQLPFHCVLTGQRGEERESMHTCVHHVGSNISLFCKFFVFQAIVRKNMENSSVPFVQFLLMVTQCKTVVQHHNQNIHINTIYPIYSDNPSFTFTWTVCVCVCVCMTFKLC